MTQYIKTFGQFVNEQYGNDEIINESSNKTEKELDKLFNELVPGSGVADTVEGEMVRAIMRIMYRYYNDGDYYFRGYGKETCAPSVDYLKSNTPISKELSKHLNNARKEAGPAYNPDEYTPKDGYYNNILKAADAIVAYVKSKKGNYEPNTEDSRL
jgi:hypothetical protein